MRIVALAAAVSMSFAPTMAMAQACPANAVLSGGACVCDTGFTLNNQGACVMPGPDVVVAIDAGSTANLPILSTIPPEAFVIGGLVFLAGAIIGIAAANDDSTTTTTTTTTN